LHTPTDDVDDNHENHGESAKPRQTKEEQSTELPVIELDNMIINLNFVHYNLTGKVAKRQGRNEIAKYTRPLDLDLVSIEGHSPRTAQGLRQNFSPTHRSINVVMRLTDYDVGRRNADSHIDKLIHSTPLTS